MGDRTPAERLGRRREAELAAFADGRLEPRRWRLVEASVAASPAQQEAVARQRRAISLLRGAERRAPEELRSRIRRGVLDPAPRRRRIAAAVAAAAGLAVAGGLGLALTLPGEIEAGPTIVQAAELASRPATSPPPSADPQRPAALGPTVGGLAFPNWGPAFGWVATGLRRDRLGDRQVTTVFYEKPGRRLAYSIVVGPPLPPPVATTDEVLEGIRVRSFLAADRAVLTFLREGRTCLLSEDRPDVDVDELFRLAGWRGDGQLRF